MGTILTVTYSPTVVMDAELVSVVVELILPQEVLVTFVLKISNVLLLIMVIVIQCSILSTTGRVMKDSKKTKMTTKEEEEETMTMKMMKKDSRVKDQNSQWDLWEMVTVIGNMLLWVM